MFDQLFAKARIMFANWAPACRVLVENVSEWFSVFFLVYRCVVGFAVLNVVSAVFVQQALKTASSDEELAFRQKQRDIQAYNRPSAHRWMGREGINEGTGHGKSWETQLMLLNPSCGANYVWKKICMVHYLRLNLWLINMNLP